MIRRSKTIESMGFGRREAQNIVSDVGLIPQQGQHGAWPHPGLTWLSLLGSWSKISINHGYTMVMTNK